MQLSIQNRNGVKLQFSAIGATWLSCQLPLADNIYRDVLLTCQDVNQNSQAFIGATIGRYANRINNALIERAQIHYKLNANQGRHQLHGGVGGFHTRTWQVIHQQANRVMFALISPNGDQGFPGQVNVTVDYLLTDDNQVVINYIAVPDKMTPINLTNHAYFNLDGEGDILAHQLYVNADYYLPVNQAGIPIGYLASVIEDDMDLRQPIILGQNLLRCPARKALNGYDHAYLLNRTDNPLSHVAAKLISGDDKVVMTVFTNKPSIQVYSGNHLKGIKSDKGMLQNYSGIALETQYLPDSPNRPDWPHESCWIDANQFYSYTTIYQFAF